ncbi:MAG: hypothetical protein ACI8W8_000166 [Rhodothermales bacterium]|jgi:hypothetical protein
MATYQIAIYSRGTRIYRRDVDVLDAPFADPAAMTVGYHKELAFRVTPPDSNCRLRICLATDPIAIGDAGATLSVPGECWFYNEIGESEIRVEVEDFQESNQFSPVLRIPVVIVPHPETQAHFEVMITDLTKIHAGLAHDVVSRGIIRQGAMTSDISELTPEHTLGELDTVFDRLKTVLRKIGRQPSRTLKNETVEAHYRSGDRVSMGALYAMLLSPGTIVDAGGRLRRLGKTRVGRPVSSEDLAEHRHIAHRIRGMAATCEGLARHCGVMAAKLGEEAERWGNRGSDGVSVFEQRDMPRIDRLRNLQQRSHALSERFLTLISNHTFLRNAGCPRTRFRPTPIFLGRPAYREVYTILCEARKLLGVMVDGESIQTSYRSLASLYEYWCFMNVVSCLRRILGNPVSNDSFVLVDAIYRPELKPGQSFVFESDRRRITVTYEPSIYEWRVARRRGDRYGASMVHPDRPLRPDILIEVDVPSRPTYAIVLDAKSTSNFSDRNFQHISDYARQIIHLFSATQPVRAVFLLHRDSRKSEHSNLPYDLRTRVDRWQFQEVGALACIPEQVGAVPELLERLLRRLLDV